MLYDSVTVDSRHIRLLHLYPLERQKRDSSTDNINLEHGQSNHTDILRGRLIRTPLKDAPVFVATSYVWGRDNDNSKDLICYTGSDHFLLSLRPNCYSMLTHLRQRYGAITVWVDSICINQQDVAERNEQVKQMERIYSQAKSVVVWLSEGTEQSDRAIDCITSAWRFGPTALANLQEETMIQRLASKLMRRYIFNMLYQRSWEFKGQGYSLQPALTSILLNGRNLQRDYKCRDLESLLHNDWLTRSWTFQEFILARQPILMCGTKVIGWPNFVFVLGYIQLQALRDNIPLPESLTRWRSLAGLWATVDWYRRHRGPDETITVWNASGHRDEQNLAEESVSAFLWSRLGNLARRVGNLQKRFLIFAWRELVFNSHQIWNQAQRAFDDAWYFTRRSSHSLQYWIHVFFHAVIAIINFILVLLIYTFSNLFVVLGPWIFLVIAPLAVSIWVSIWKHWWWPVPILGIFWAKLSLFPARIFIRDYKLLGHEPDRIFHFRTISRPSEVPQRPSRPSPSRPSYPGPAVHQPLPSRLFRAVQTPPDKVFKWGLVEAIRERKCSEPRDKAYAMHSILQLAGIKHQSVDYNRHLPTVYRSLLIHLLKFSPDFAVLFLDSGMHSHQLDTTWVPDWTDNGWRTWLDPRYVQFKNPWSATTPLVEDTGFVFDDQDRPILSGCWIDVCRNAYLFERPSTVAEIAQPEWLKLRDWLSAASYSSRAEFATYEERESNIHEALSGTLLDSTRIVPYNSTQLLCYVKSASDGILPDDRRVQPWICNLFSDLRARRSLFITEEGRLGSGPFEMRQGDKIALVTHVPVPLVFRNTMESGRYQLVGPAFVAGVMRGEAWGVDVRREDIHLV